MLKRILHILFVLEILMTFIQGSESFLYANNQENTSTIFTVEQTLSEENSSEIINTITKEHILLEWIEVISEEEEEEEEEENKTHQKKWGYQDCNPFYTSFLRLQSVSNSNTITSSFNSSDLLSSISLHILFEVFII